MKLRVPALSLQISASMEVFSNARSHAFDRPGPNVLPNKPHLDLNVGHFLCGSVG